VAVVNEREIAGRRAMRFPAAGSGVVELLFQEPSSHKGDGEADRQKALIVNQSRHGFAAVVANRSVDEEVQVEVFMEGFGPYEGRVAWVKDLSSDPLVLLVGVELVEDV
jgi:hypothetical protein